jgi:hypothetical protein
MALTEIQQKIFDKVLEEWEKRVGLGNVDKETLADIIKFADTDGDGKKRIGLFGETHLRLVPIEDIILNGVKGTDLEKYPFEKKNPLKKICKNCQHFTISSCNPKEYGFCTIENCGDSKHELNHTCSKFKQKWKNR